MSFIADWWIIDKQSISFLKRKLNDVNNYQSINNIKLINNWSYNLHLRLTSCVTCLSIEISELLIQDQSSIDFVLVIDDWMKKSSINHENFEMTRRCNEKSSAKR